MGNIFLNLSLLLTISLSISSSTAWAKAGKPNTITGNSEKSISVKSDKKYRATISKTEMRNILSRNNMTAPAVFSSSGAGSSRTVQNSTPSVKQIACGSNPIATNSCTSDNTGTWVNGMATSSSAGTTYTYYECCMTGYAEHELVLTREQQQSLTEGASSVAEGIEDFINDVWDAYYCSGVMERGSGLPDTGISGYCMNEVNAFVDDVFTDCAMGVGEFAEGSGGITTDNIYKKCCEGELCRYDSAENKCTCTGKNQADYDDKKDNVMSCVEDAVREATNEHGTSYEYCEVASQQFNEVYGRQIYDDCMDRIQNTSATCL